MNDTTKRKQMTPFQIIFVVNVAIMWAAVESVAIFWQEVRDIQREAIRELI